MVVVRSPFPSTVGETDARARRRRWALGLVLAGSLALNAFLLVRGESPRAAPAPWRETAAAPGSEDASEADPTLAESEEAVYEAPATRAEDDAELARLRERLEPFEKMAPADAIVFSGRDFGWILRRLAEAPPADRAHGIARLVEELRRREDGAATVLSSLFGESDPVALRGLALVLEHATFARGDLAGRTRLFSTDERTMGRIVASIRDGQPFERRLAAARAVGDFVVPEAEMHEQAVALAARVPEIGDPQVAEALGWSLLENGHFTQFPAVRDALLLAARTSDRAARRALLTAYAAADVNPPQPPAVSPYDMWPAEPSRDRREDLAYAFARARVETGRPRLPAETDEERRAARERLLAAYREATELEARRYLVAAALRSQALGVGSERSAHLAAFAAAEPSPEYRRRLEEAATRIAQDERFDAATALLAP